MKLHIFFFPFVCIFSPECAGYVTSVASPTGPSGSAHKQPQQLHSQAVVSLAAASKRSQHLVKSNSETDAHQLERALEEQLQFSEEDNRKLL